jgi:hypothetical protein
MLRLPEFDLAESTETRSVGDIGEATITSYLSVHSRPEEGEPPYRFGTPHPSFRRVGALSSPAPDVGGERLNPVASEPLAELIAGERGRELLQQTGVFDVPDFDWQRPPTEVGTREVRLLGGTTQAQSFIGVAVGEVAGPTTLLANLARIVTDGNAVVVGEFVRRRTPDGPLDVEGQCVDGLCQMLSPEQVDMWEQYQRVLEHMSLCTEVTLQGNTVEVCGGSGGSTDVDALPKVSIENARLVQHVENTVVKAPGSTATYSEANPDLVEGENTAVVFEFDTLENIDALGEPLEVEVIHGDYGAPNRSRESFEIPRQDLKDIAAGEHTTSVLHRLADDGDSANDNPVFSLSSNPSVVVTTPTLVRFDFWERITPSRSVVDVDPLTVGFVALEDKRRGSRYGDSDGQPRNIRRSFASASAYLRRAYPGDIVTYGHTNHTIVGDEEVTEKKNVFGVTTRAGCDDACVIYRDMKRVRRQLDRMATDSSYPPTGSGFPNGGVLDTDGRSRSAMVSKIKNEGFDVVVAIVPEDDPSNGGATGYYDYHNQNWAGVAFGDPAAAVSSLGASASGNDRGISHTVAQEVGHYFQTDYLSPSTHPMAQRRNDSDDNNQPTVNGKPLDPSHARNQNSNRVSGGDAPGVVSTAYDLRDGFRNLQQYKNPDGAFSVTGPSRGATDVEGVPSFMSYTGKNHEVWTDARIHQQLIDSDWTPPNTSGSGSSAYTVSAVGSVTEAGAVRYDDVAAQSGVDRYPDFDDAPVRVALLDPGGEELVTARVPAEVRTTHHGDGYVGEPVVAPSFTLPFDPLGVAVRTSYDGTTTTMNPVERSVRDAVTRVPAAGFAGEPSAAGDDIGPALDAVAGAMADGRYGDAAGAMDGPVREAIRKHVVGYDARLGEPTAETLFGLVDEMARRLRGLAETNR